MFGLPDGVAACLFDMDGVITQTAVVHAAGISTAIVSSSANTQLILDSAGPAELFDVRVDGVIAKEHGLRGKPAPDTLLAAAEALHVPASRAVVFEDALAGVEAGRAGHFALVVGVDRVGQAKELEEHGADIVVQDLAELLDRDGQPDKDAP